MSDKATRKNKRTYTFWKTTRWSDFALEAIVLQQENFKNGNRRMYEDPIAVLLSR